MKVYLSCPSTNLDEARAAVARILDAGHELSHDWVEVVARQGPMTAKELADHGEDDIRGVVEADVLIVLLPDGSLSIGVAVELGAAYACAIRVILVEPTVLDDDWALHPFRALADHRVDSVAEALHLLADGEMRRHHG